MFRFGCLATFWFGTFAMLWYFCDPFFVPLGVLFIMKTPEDEQSIVIKANKPLPLLRFGEIFCIIIYCMSALSLHTESTDSIIQTITLLYSRTEA